ncbi:MAG: glycosyltransferase family 9 protein [Chitinophagaceae bacterium]|nr:glycosyltransferase family 9 protein [Oligoflexus sp.]
MFTPPAMLPLIKIGIIRSTSIGDVVLATACIDFLRQIPAPVEITWVGRRPALQLIASAFPEIKVVDVDPDAANYQDKVAEELKEMHFVIDLQTNLRSQLLCRVLKKDYKIQSYSADKRSLDRGTMTVVSRLRGRRRTLPPELQSAEVYQYVMMLKTLREALEVHLPVEMLDGMDQIKAVPSLLSEHDTGETPWQKELKFGRWLAIAPGAAYETKRAPLQLFQEITELLSQTVKQDKFFEHQTVGLLFVGNEQERDIALAILDKVDWKGPVLNLAGKLNLWETALALREADALLCNDSALLHVAEAVGVPVAALFGPTVEAFGFPPWRPESKAFSSSLGCRPCSKHGKQDCRYGDKLCFGLIQAVQVVDHLKGIMKQKLPAHESTQNVK